jgi:hypothetical protein
VPPQIGATLLKGLIMGLNYFQKKYVAEHWIAGDSAQMIASELRKTRNSILGYVHREQNKGNLPTRGQMGNRKKSGPRLVVPRELKRVAPAIQPPPPPQEPEFIGPLNMFPITPDETHGACQFTHDHPGHGDWRMCGHATKNPAYPWCPFHAAYIFNKGKIIGVNFNGQAAAETSGDLRLPVSPQAGGAAA